MAEKKVRKIGTLKKMPQKWSDQELSRVKRAELLRLKQTNRVDLEIGEIIKREKTARANRKEIRVQYGKETLGNQGNSEILSSIFRHRSDRTQLLT